MNIAPYQTKLGKLYIPCKRGDEIISPHHKPTQKIRDGMCGGYIDPSEWKNPPTISIHSQGETLWIEIPKTEANLKFAKEAGQRVNQPKIKFSSKLIKSGFDLKNLEVDDNYRPMKHWIDFNKLNAHVPDFHALVYEEKHPIPVMRLNSIPQNAIKNSIDVKPYRRFREDVGKITEGVYTIGGNVHNDYPTFGGAAGVMAHIGDFTNNLYLQLDDSIVETAVAELAKSLNGYILDISSNNPHSGDATQGYLIQENTDGSWGGFFYFKHTGPGTINVKDLRHQWIGATYTTFEFHYLIYSCTNYSEVNLHDLILDGADKAQEGIVPLDSDVKVNAWNNIIYNHRDCEYLIYTAYPSGIVANCTFPSGKEYGFFNASATCLLYNVAAYNCPSGCFYNTSDSQSYSCVSDDGTADDANWSGGANNIPSGNLDTDVESTIIASGASYLKPTLTGNLYNNGTNVSLSNFTHYINDRKIVTDKFDIGAKGIARLDGLSTFPSRLPYTSSGILTELRDSTEGFWGSCSIYVNGTNISGASVIDTDTMTFIAPTGALNTSYDLIVYNGDGLSGVLLNGLKYFTPEIIRDRYFFNKKQEKFIWNLGE